MLDSPYVRRVAISLQLLGLRFTHQPLSVFRTFEQFSVINPVVKAPTLVCDDGTVLMDSSLILDYVERLAPAARPLWPAGLPERRQALRVVGLALAACEKSVQMVYETFQRPAERRHEPWMDRLNVQLLAAYRELEAELVRAPLLASADGIDQAGICTAVAWRFTREMVPQAVPVGDFPRIAAFSAAAELLPQFQSAQYGLGAYTDTQATAR
jgi:glutathione S-transferase